MGVAPVSDISGTVLSKTNVAFEVLLSTLIPCFFCMVNGIMPFNIIHFICIHSKKADFAID